MEAAAAVARPGIFALRRRARLPAEAAPAATTIRRRFSLSSPLTPRPAATVAASIVAGADGSGGRGDRWPVSGGARVGPFGRPGERCEGIRDLHIAKQVEDIGFYAGFVGSSYMIGRALTSTLWGMVADKHGRKPVLVITLIAVIILNALFGLSSSYWMALTTRCLLGLLSGMLGPIKAYAMEVCRKEYSHLALSLISSSRAIGLIVGPAIGGYLSQPADKYPGIFPQQSIFGRFPYFLPCLCMSLLAVVALISCIWLPETLHKHNQPADSNNSTETVEESVSERNAEESGGGYCSLFTNWPLISSITVYCILSLQDVAYAEVFSLWAVSDRKYGGLSFTSTDVGNILALTGFCLLLYQILVYPLVAKSIEPVTIVRATAILTLPLLSSYPFMTALSGFSLHLVVNCASFLKNSFQIFVGSAAPNCFVSSRGSLGVFHAKRGYIGWSYVHLRTALYWEQKEALMQ